MTLYRKYRPQTLDQVIGQDAVTAILGQAIKSDKVAHAYLFAGPRGTGKTSVARILARALNCQEYGQQEQVLPCNQCANCLAITSGAFLDVVELDAASNRGIDEMRALKEQVILAPSLGRYKIYILDEVHMLTAEAFNALLKTLEEPPSHVIFILCTTEGHKVPITITSRCQRFVFQPANISQIHRQLRTIADAERIVIEDDALALLAELADGGFRDGAMLLEQMIAASYSTDTSADKTSNITRAAIERRLGLANQEVVKGIMSQLVDRQHAQAIQQIEQFVAQGGDVRYLLSSLIDQARLLLFCQVSPQTASTMAGGAHLEWATQLAQQLPAPFLLSLVKSLATAQAAKPSPHVALPLEVALLDAGQQLSSAPLLATAITNNSVIRQSSLSQRLPMEVNVVPSSDDQPKASSDSQPIHLEPSPTAVEARQKVKTSAGIESVEQPMALSPDSALDDHWPKILEAIRPQSRSVEALLRDCTPLSFDGTILLLQFWYSFHKKQLELDKNRHLVESVASQLFGRPVKIKCQLGDKSARPKKPMAAEDIHNIATVVEEPDLVEAATEIFGGEIIE